MIRMELDRKNHLFTESILNYFQDLKQFSTPYLEWLNMEHYQFSLHNTRFLMAAHRKTQSLSESGVAKELLANYNEEKNHAQMYQYALKKIGLDVSSRQPHSTTQHFFSEIEQLIHVNASRTLGVMYATETAAIFEHVLFKNIAQALCQRKQYDFVGSRIKHFHDLHLDGVEQAHKDELGQFIDHCLTHEGTDPHVDLLQDEVVRGAHAAIAAMQTWWMGLVSVKKEIELVCE